MTVALLGRGRSLKHTLRTTAPWLEKLGVTRVAEQTGLDRIGLPCFASFRPNARSLSVHQGKGRTRDAARISAMMEAIEYAIAEAPAVATHIASAKEAVLSHGEVFWPVRLLPGTMKMPDEPIEWLLGRGAFSGRKALVPRDACTMTGRAANLPGICQTTNGLASGNSGREASLYALCELIERDANTLWGLRPLEEQVASALWHEDFRCPTLTALVNSCLHAGCKVRLFDHTSDIGVPVIGAMLLEGDGKDGQFAATAGYAAHPIARIAAYKALAEAAQSRVTAIAGARDDIRAQAHGESLDESIVKFFHASETPAAAAPKSLVNDKSPSGLFAAIERAFHEVCIDEPVVVDLTPPTFPFAVVRALSNLLEDFPGNANWRPGQRALSVVAGQ